MTLENILEHRRAIRKYDPNQPLEDSKVKDCIRMATLAPSSSNMQLWECYHVTDKETLGKLAHACLDQGSARTAQQMVVFVTRQDLYRDHAQKVLRAAIDDILKNSPKDKQARRIRLQRLYYKRVMPMQYARFLGIKGLLNKILAQTIGLFRPIVRQVSEGEVSTVVHKSCALALLWWYGLTWLIDKLREKFDIAIIVIINKLIGSAVIVFSLVVLVGTVFNLYTFQ